MAKKSAPVDISMDKINEYFNNPLFNGYEHISSKTKQSYRPLFILFFNKRILFLFNVFNFFFVRNEM